MSIKESSLKRETKRGRPRGPRGPYKVNGVTKRSMALKVKNFKKNLTAHDDMDEYYSEKDLAKKYLKIPTYTNNFVHVVSRKVGYKTFLKHSAQLNGGTLPYMTREVFENAWKELVEEKYKAWKTVHSETTKRSALKVALSLIEPSLYPYYCQPHDDNPPQVDAAKVKFVRGFEPIPPKPEAPQYLKHPAEDHKLIVIPEKILKDAKDAYEKAQKEARDEAKRKRRNYRKRSGPKDDFLEDDDEAYVCKHPERLGLEAEAVGSVVDYNALDEGPDVE